MKNEKNPISPTPKAPHVKEGETMGEKGGTMREKGGTMREKVTVVKVGGAIVEEEERLRGLLNSFCEVEGMKVLVHGGGRSATRIAASLGIESHMVDGRRITDDAMLDVVTMVYGGLVNKHIVASLVAGGVNALGITGADMNLIQAHKRTPAASGGVDYGWVGDVDSCQGQTLGSLLRESIVPVIAPLTHDGQGHLLNTNADTMAATVAEALATSHEVTLVFAFERAGVLGGEDESSVIPHLNLGEYHHLRAEGVISGGMIPKLDNAFEAIAKGVRRVIVTSANDLRGTHGTMLE